MSDWEEHDREFIEKAESLPENRCSRSKHWRLMEGALVTGSNGIPARVLKVEGNRVLLYTGCLHLDGQSGSEMFWADATPSYYFPVLSDEATLGCLLALVRAAWADEGCAAVVASYTFESGYRWRVVGGHHHGSGFMAMSKKHYQTEAEALVAALEEAGPSAYF